MAARRRIVSGIDRTVSGREIHRRAHEIDPARIEKFCERISRPALRYTQLTPQSDLAAAGVLFVDTIGILSSVYRYGRWGYIGGGFGAGIHNTLEAATFGLPLAFDPVTGNSGRHAIW